MKLATRPGLLLLTLLGALSAGASGIPLGTRELGPAPGGRSEVAAAGHATGYVTAWIDGRINGNDVYIARLDSRGELLDPEGVHVQAPARTQNGESPLVAADGTDAVVVWRTGFNRGTVHSSLVTADHVTPARAIAADATPLALGWSGRHYIVVLRHRANGISAMLLGRDGLPASGMLRLSATANAARLACRGTDCFVAHMEARGFVPGAPVRGGIIREADFPPSGQTASVILPRLFSARDVVVGADESGYYTVAQPASPQKLVVRRYPEEWEPSDSDRPEREGWFRRERLPRPPQAYDTPSLFEPLSTVADDGVIYVVARRDASGGVLLLRLVGGAAEAVVPPAPANLQVTLALASGPSGVAVFWGDGRHHSHRWENRSTTQIDAALLNSSSWHSGGVLVSSSRAREVSPRIARGKTSFLATWVEYRRDAKLFAAVIDGGGKPAAGPFLLAHRQSIVQSALAFDGERFLVVWLTYNEASDWGNDWGWRLFACFVTPEGHATEPFLLPVVPDLSLSLFWDGDHYILGVEGGVARLNRSGVVVESAVGDWDDLGGVHLAYDPETRRYSGVGLEYRGSAVSAGPSLYVYSSPIEATRGLQLASRGESRVFGGYYSRPPAPAVAAGGGHSIAIVHEGFSPDTLRIAPKWDVLPYFSAGTLQALWFGREFLVAAGRHLARHSAENGAVRAVQSLGGEVTESAIAVADSASVLAVVQRGGFAENFNGGSSTIGMPRVELLHVGVPPLP